MKSKKAKEKVKEEEEEEEEIPTMPDPCKKFGEGIEIYDDEYYE